MAQSKAYRKAEEKIAEALRTGATKLSLSGMRLTELPESIGQLTQLQTLNLSSNQLTALPESLGQLTQLQELRLHDNQLTTLPESLGQLTQLQKLYVAANQLTALPVELGNPPRLTLLSIHRNPLPTELLKLRPKSGQPSEKLLSFLRAQAEAKASQDEAALRRFDEAKLLLVGPGEVGKTWLLRALRGTIPIPTSSTRGIEIAREPLELPHPKNAERTLHLTCWDFGGQDHYQVTHQIFFSAKAVYLLVWKPREGFDPEMESRLERIQLSAGRTAKVLIVSTHADEEVTAVLGQDALRERFGDLIQGFYRVDSSKGSYGTGIAKLKAGIAHAVAQLQGIDLDFPAAWHAAQQDIRKIEEPSVPFRDILKICDGHGLDADMADSITQMMEVQGHAVYFPEAATEEEAGALARENIVVLKPEWLAKAISFVIDDETTNDAQGILHHARLATIWRKNDKRGCPGYHKKVRSFLLWLMWKFDVAYKQDGDTSLLPEMIARTRPDDLLWHADTESQGPEVRALCIFTSASTRKGIAIPKGLVPAFTAAVHSLRQARDSADPDKLDRNWNSGFFLHTEHRGDAFVEQQDRELHFITRHTYPRMLFDQLQRTLDQLVPTRWPQARIDLRVPCRGTIDSKPCPETFRTEWLDKQRGKLVLCQECDGDFAAARLLDGFDPKEAEILSRLQQLRDGQTELLDGQRELLAAAHAMFLAIDPEQQERRRAPNLFTILPEKGGWSLTTNKVRLTCWCEHPDGPHPASPIGSNEPPDFVLSTPKGWVVKSAPYVSWAVMLLKAFTPLAGNFAGQVTDDLTDKIDLMKDIAKALPSGKLDIGEAREFELEPGENLTDSYRRSHTPELEALSLIHDLLLDKIPVAPNRWGGLRPVQTKSGELLWLCAEHAEIQSPAPQEI